MWPLTPHGPTEAPVRAPAHPHSVRGAAFPPLAWAAGCEEGAYAEGMGGEESVCPVCGQPVETVVKRHKTLGAWVPVWGRGPCRNPDCAAYTGSGGPESDRPATAGPGRAPAPGSDPGPPRGPGRSAGTRNDGGRAPERPGTP